jgi:HD superfamily phosphohydrolase YqeK
MAGRSGDPLAIKQALAAIKLPAMLWQRLTVMRTQRLTMFEHSLRVAMIAYALAQRLGLPAGERDVLLAAALCHDVGEMHTDPLLLAAEHDITPEERRYIHVHPLTSYVLLHDIPGFPAAACQAVLYHHERLDGSGYPHGARGDKIPLLAKLIAVADVAETVIRRFDLPRLDMLARLHYGRFDHAAVDALRDLIHFTQQDTAPHPPPQGAARQLHRLADVLQAWYTLREVFERQVAPAAPEVSPLAFLVERMRGIRQLVLQAGIDPDHIDDILALSREDPAILLELHTMLDEMEWLQLDLANEIDRRAPQLAGLASESLSGLVHHLRPVVALSIPAELLGIAPDDEEAEAAPPRH